MSTFGHLRSLSITIAGLTLVAACLPMTAQASQVRPVNLEEMTERADRIFHGTCVDVRQAVDADLGRTVARVTFRVDRAIKGDLDPTLTIKILDAGAATSSGHPGLPQFRHGEEVVLFLYGDSSLGLTSPVGFGQGKFAVFEDKQGRKQAINAFGNQRLLEGVSSETTARLGQSVGRRDAGEIELDRLIDTTETLSRRSLAKGGAR